MIEGYDIIGDIHGEAGKLHALLARLDYQWEDGCFRHPTRKAVFLGDFIDRGPHQRQVLVTIMPMVREGAALAVMGNHELNAIGYHTEDPDHPGEYLRPRTHKNNQQHKAFLEAFSGAGQEGKLEQVLEFFKSLPVYLKLDGINAVHACWHPGAIEDVQPYLDEGGRLKAEHMAEYFREGSIPGSALNILLKGTECNLPSGVRFHDKDGGLRTRARTRWWSTEAETLADLVVGCDLDQLSNYPTKYGLTHGYPPEAPPVFFGHYWFDQEPAPIRDNIACLDYSAARGGRLVAYRWSGEAQISADNFAWVGRDGLAQQIYDEALARSVSRDPAHLEDPLKLPSSLFCLLPRSRFGPELNRSRVG